MPRRPDATAGFLNVDLDVYSRSNLAPLAAELEKKALVLFVGREGNRYGSHFELLSCPKDADSAIRGLAALIRSLPSATRRLWDRATTRDFNIGILSAANRRIFEIQLSNKAIKSASELRGRIVATVYGADLGNSKARVNLRRSRNHQEPKTRAKKRKV